MNQFIGDSNRLAENNAALNGWRLTWVILTDVTVMLNIESEFNKFDYAKLKQREFHIVYNLPWHTALDKIN
jgi:hypothetical protein